MINIKKKIIMKNNKYQNPTERSQKQKTEEIDTPNTHTNDRSLSSLKHSKAIISIKNQVLDFDIWQWKGSTVNGCNSDDPYYATNCS